MAFDNIGAFAEAGRKAGEESQSPFGYGAQNVMDLFKMQQENAYKLAQTAALFQGEKQYEYGTDPTKIAAGKNLQAMSDTDNGGSVGGGSGGAAFPGTTAGATASGGPAPATKGNMIQQSAEGFGGKKFVNPGVGAQEQLMKDRLNQDVAFSSLNSAINAHLGAVKAYHNAIGPGGMLPNMTAGAAANMGDPYVSGAKQMLDTANETLAQRIAKEVNPGGIGRILSATRSQVGNDNSTETGQVAANIQLQKDYYGFKKAYDMASYSNPMDKQMLFNPDGTKKDFNNLDDNASAYLAGQKDKVISPEEMQYFDKSGIANYQNMPPSAVVNPRTGESYSGASRSATAMAPFGAAISKIPGVGAFMDKNAGFPDTQNKPASSFNKLQQSSVDPVAERKIIQQKIASGKYDADKLKVIYKQRTGQDYGG